MGRKTMLALGCAAAALIVGGAQAQDSATPPAGQPAAPVSTGPAANATTSDPGEIIVTARQREETLKDVPVAVSAVTGDTLRQQQVYQVRDVANYVPGLNINSDGVGRAFVSMRGIGTTLIDTVQPGVGIFIDGIYQPNTSYLNSPLVDVARIEVLRGPQGTLFGNNTLGGAINVITNQPTNDFHVRLDGSVAPQDDFHSVSGSVSGPIVRDVVQFRIAAAYHHQDGFTKDTLHPTATTIEQDVPQNPLTQKSVNGTLRVLPASWATITVNANYDDVFGGNANYIDVSGPTDYSEHGSANILNLARIKYTGVNAKGVFDADAINTQITLIGAYNRKHLTGVSDGDMSPYDLLRSAGGSTLNTYTGELRFDTKWSDRFSTLVGLFADDQRTGATNLNTLFLLLDPAGPSIAEPSSSFATNKNEAVFGTAFWKFADSWELDAGVRLDHQKLTVSQVNSGVGFTAPDYRKTQVQPRFTLTKHFTPDAMAYASIARGVRGGGQNGPGAPNPIYRGDEVWTYELGTKLDLLDRRLSFNADVFYNDYKHFIGQNALAPIATGYVAVNLNTGTVHSYGAEFEMHARPTDNWRVDGSLTLLHARITNDDEFVATTGVPVSSNRLIFTPDWNFNIGTNYTVPLANRDKIVFEADLIGKGSRIGSSLNPDVAPRLSHYYLVNGSIAYRFTKGLELAVFTTNLLNQKYIESYIDISDLSRAGVPAPIASDLAIQGDRRRIGVRASVKF